MKVLTEKQEKFLSVLFQDAEGDPLRAKRLAGYSESTSVKEVTDALRDEISQLTKDYIARVGVEAVWAIGSLVRNPNQLGAQHKLAAARDILDRAGFRPQEKVQVESANPIFILPPKDSED
jgi:hypothetical protein